MPDDVSMHADEDWVTIESHDGFVFSVTRKVANASGTLRSMLDEQSNFAESASRTCKVDERGCIVQKVCEYMAFKVHYEGRPNKDEALSEWQDRIPPEIALELLLAADYLEV